MRLIDADALMSKFAEFVRASNNSDFATVPRWNDAVSLLESAPTIEAEPKKHGRWIKSEKSDFAWECSNCGYGLSDYRTTYCYDCGARMDEVEE